MKRIKSILKKYPRTYRLFQKIYYNLRQFIETHVFGTKLQEWIWRRRRLDYTKEYINKVPHPHRQILINTINTHASINSILEIGCASGLNLRLIAKKFPETKIIGMDINKKAVELGNELFKKEGITNVKLYIGKADELRQFPDKSFDIVFTDATLIYIAPDKIKKIAEEMKRIAKKAIILVEYHSEKESDLGSYNMGNWVRDYKKLFQQFSSKIKIIKIPPEIWGGDWGRDGYIIEVIL